ncbi:hypothetical protein U8607_15340 [Methylobacterium durans]|uniref:Uncharacterized protein n=1 Tax=Methylobacterium durans TaxID=2202825 RepID=A0A2U8WDC7_9HYPH|nr:hypothetical protein [Methylobacterium durans]AWN43316.1 hypothetical protein DK389_25940 [Methylobacterium durans]MEA1833458.1 hypothetical protein [Methylobacterium durans]
MAEYWINAFRRWDGATVFRESDATGRPNRRRAETPMMYQGTCRLTYRVRVRPRCAEAAACGRRADGGFIDLSGSCPRCGAPQPMVCAAAFRA